MSTSLTEAYRITERSVVTLKISIGYAQIAVSTVGLEKDELAHNEKGSFEITLDSSGAELHGKTLYCTTIVTDISPETDETSVTFELTGGVKTQGYALQQRVKAAGGIVFYAATFLFYL